MNPFGREEPSFIADLALHAGRYRGMTDGLKCWEIRDPKQEPFKDILEDVCQNVSQCHSIPRSTLLLIDIFLRGETLESSVCYVMLSGTIKRHRKTAVRHLRRSPLLRHYPGLKVDHWDWPPQAPSIIMTGQNGKTPDNDLLYRCPQFNIRRLAARNAEETKHGLNSSLLSIIATNNGEGTSRAGTLSCFVAFGQDAFFFVPAHIFMPRPLEEHEQDADMEDSDSDRGSESDCESGILRVGSATPSDLSSASKSTIDEGAQEGLLGSWRTLESGPQRLNPTQPSLAIEGFEIFSFENDYALLPVPQGETLHQGLCCISEEIVERIDTGQFAVSVVTPSRGLMNGLLDGRPTFMRLPYSSRFTQLYPISLPDSVSEGDCGSVVIDQTTKKIYGFIAAASIEGRVVYIVSADDILLDITARLGKRCIQGWLSESTAFTDQQLRSSSICGNSSDSLPDSRDSESSLASADHDTITDRDFPSSLTSFIICYRSENGRRYHAYRDGAYWGPNDERQQEAEDIMHELYRLVLDGKLYDVPLRDNIKAVLDVGCGTGTWAMEFAEDHLGAEVVGIDLSPIQPNMVPPNCHFEVDDINDEWTFPEGHFDFIHIRGMTGSVPDWVEFYKKTLRHLGPGGWAQQIDLSCVARSDDDTITEDSPYVKWVDVFTKLGEASGKTFFACEQASAAIRQAGFINTTERRIKLPIGTWPRDKQLKLWGAWHRQFLVQGVEGFSIRGLTDILGWSYSEAQVFLSQMQNELLNPKVHAFIELCIVGGQKPE